MTQSDFIYDQVYKGALNAGAMDSQALNHAVMALDDFKKNKFSRLKKNGRGTVLDLIQHHITQAKRSKQ